MGSDWLVSQGACQPERRYDRNAGRKCVARYTRRLNLDYPPVFQLVGDLPNVWRENYDPLLPPCDYKVRKQSTDPLVATHALRLFAKVILKRGCKVTPRLSRSDRLAYGLLKSREGEEEADRVLFGYDAEN